MDKKTIKDLKLDNKKVLIRVDYNVSLNSRFKIADDTRIKQTIPTLLYLLKKNCALILIAHLGRPEGKINRKLSLKPLAKYLEKILNRKVDFCSDYLSKEGREKIKKIKPGQIILLENLRFHKEEKANDAKFAKKLAGLAEVFVNDGFGVSHRRHASTTGVTMFLPSVAGLLLEKEIDIFSKVLKKPKHPFVSIIGGAKTETKIKLINKLLEKSDFVILGGCIANTFLKARGYNVGKSKIDKQAVKTAKHLIWKAARMKTSLMMPTDAVLGTLETGYVNGVEPTESINPKLQMLDIGPRSEAEFGNLIANAGTIIWNGPMGVAEKKEFSHGTTFIYYAIAQNKKAFSIVGGGETLACLPKKEYLQAISHLSTGGGAMLEFIEKGTLPGIEALQDK